MKAEPIPPPKLSLRAGLLLGLLACVASAEALEYGHVRARTRGFEYRLPGGHTPEAGEPTDGLDPETTIGEASSAQSELEAEDLEAGLLLGPVDAPPRRESVAHAVGRTLRRGTQATAGVLLLGRGGSGPDLRKLGYLAHGAPPALRFSDAAEVNRRPPSPALPEFTAATPPYEPFLIESPLPKDAMTDPSILSELVVELEPHTVLSGKIETRSVTQEERVEGYDLEEHRADVLRPEDILIFFESDGQISNTGAVIPFAPATPVAPAPRSSAILRKE